MSSEKTDLDFVQSILNELNLTKSNTLDNSVLGNSKFSQTETTYSYEDTRMFDDFLSKTGGHTGGWDSEDHNMFVCLIKKHNISSVVHLLRDILPDIEEEDIIEHDKWYKEYIKLKGRHKNLIKLWRSEKDKTTSIENPAIKTPFKKSIKSSNNDVVKEKIKHWKEMQKLRKNAEEQIKILLSERCKRENEIRRTKQEHVKVLLKKNREEKLNFKQAYLLAQSIEQENEKRVAAIRANKMLEKFRQKDAELLEKKMSKKNHSLKEQEEREARIKSIASKSSNSIQVCRDPSRLLQPTKQWEQKIREPSKSMSDEVVLKPSMNIASIQHLATPVWRRCL